MADIDFDIGCLGPHVTVHQRPALSSPRDSIAHRYRQKNERKKRLFTLSIPADTSTTTIDYIEERYALTAGRVLPMNFTPTGESATEVRFASPLKTVRQNAVQGTATVELEELL